MSGSEDPGHTDGAEAVDCDAGVWGRTEAVDDGAGAVRGQGKRKRLCGGGWNQRLTQSLGHILVAPAFPNPCLWVL